MNNKIVTTIGRLLVQLGCVVLRFNFRGVGRSVGHFDQGDGESEDLDAIRQWLIERYPGQKSILAGFSFGSFVSYRSASAWPPDLLISVAPPVENFDFAAYPRPACPWIVVQGDQDEVVDPDQVLNWLETCSPPEALIRLADSGHFFHGQLLILRDQLHNALLDFIKN